MDTSQLCRAGALLAALALAPPVSVMAQAVTADTSYLTHVAHRARARADQLTPATQTPDARAEAQYREAVSELDRGAWSDASVSLQAALQRARSNGKYRGDLAYAYARQGNWDEAHANYVSAFQSMQQNMWYLVGAAFSKAQQRAWADAAGTVQLAVQTDSSVVDLRLAREAAGWFEQAGDRNQALAWSRLAVARDSTDAQSWLRIASYLNARNDTGPEAAVAFRKAYALNPEDRLANGLYAGWLFHINQVDSALARSLYAAQDSSYREFAAHLHLEAGRLALGRRDIVRSRRLLDVGLPWATEAQRPTYANLIGRGDLLRATAMLLSLETRSNCDTARVVDTLLASAERNLLAGGTYDSARTNMIVTQVIPNYKRQAAQAVESSCRAAPARPAPRRRPEE